MPWRGQCLGSTLLVRGWQGAVPLSGVQDNRREVEVVGGNGEAGETTYTYAGANWERSASRRACFTDSCARVRCECGCWCECAAGALDVLLSGLRAARSSSRVVLGWQPTSPAGPGLVSCSSRLCSPATSHSGCAGGNQGDTVWMRRI